MLCNNRATLWAGSGLTYFPVWLQANATLDSDPNNPANGTVPKPTTEIAHLLVGSSFRDDSILTIRTHQPSTDVLGCLYRIRKQILDNHRPVGQSHNRQRPNHQTVSCHYSRTITSVCRWRFVSSSGLGSPDGHQVPYTRSAIHSCRRAHDALQTCCFEYERAEGRWD